MSKEWPDKVIIGLTGNIATGKSAVMRFAAENGALPIDADKVVHHILSTNEVVQTKIAETFGDSVTTPSGGIDRAALGKLVFEDAAKLEQLEALVHPQVRPLVVAQINQSDAKVVIIEAIKLLEGGLVDYCDQVWVTNCGKFLQLQRLIIARGMDENAAFDRIVAQAPQADKIARADVVIDTSGSIAETRKQVAAAWQGIMLSDVAEASAVETVVHEEKAQEAVQEPAAPAAEPAAKPVASVEEPAAEPAAPAEDVEVVVRRARPSDIPSIMLLIHKATDGKVKPKRAEILMSLSERGYLIGQIDSQISTVVGWYADKGFASIEQMYVHPPEMAMTTGTAVVSEVNKTANELMCEAVFAFLPEDGAPEYITNLLTSLEYKDDSDKGNWPRVWKQGLADAQPENTNVMVRKLWNARVA